MPFYTRTIANAGFGYNWKAGNYQEHIVNPIQFNVIKLPFIDPAYQKSIEQSSYLANSYKDVLILGGNYSFIFNNQKIKNSKNYWFLRLNAEASGNLLSAIYKITGQPKKDTTFSTLAPPFAQYSLFGQPFAQYVKTDLDVRYNYRFNDVSSIVYRGFFGIGIPYGNSKAVPFEKQYFSGGANGIRAWQVRSLGPGSYDPIPPGDTTLPFLIKQLISSWKQMLNTGLSFSGFLKALFLLMSVISGPIMTMWNVRAHNSSSIGFIRI